MTSTLTIVLRNHTRFYFQECTALNSVAYFFRADNLFQLYLWQLGAWPTLYAAIINHCLILITCISSQFEYHLTVGLAKSQATAMTSSESRKACESSVQCNIGIWLLCNMAFDCDLTMAFDSYSRKHRGISRKHFGIHWHSQVLPRLKYRVAGKGSGTASTANHTWKVRLCFQLKWWRTPERWGLCPIPPS